MRFGLESDLLQRQKSLRLRLSQLTQAIAAEVRLIGDDDVEGEALDRAICSRDTLEAEKTAVRVELDRADLDLRCYGKAHAGAGRAGFSELVGEDGVPLNSIRRLTW